MIKKISIVLVMVMAMGLMPIASYAQESDRMAESTDPGVMRPMWDEISQFANAFQITRSGEAILESIMLAFDVDEIKITAYLQKYEGNGVWVTIKRWTSTSTDIACFLSESKYVMSNNSYRMVSTGTVYEDGSPVEQNTYVSDPIDY